MRDRQLNTKRKTHKTLKDGTLMTWPLCMYGQRKWMAVMDFRNTPADATGKEIDKLLSTYREISQAPCFYVSYTDLRPSRLAYPRIFAVVKTLKMRDPYSVNVTVNRMGENVCVKFDLGRIS